jgi:hypothetical protein
LMPVARVHQWRIGSSMIHERHDLFRQTSVVGAGIAFPSQPQESDLHPSVQRSFYPPKP